MEIRARLWGELYPGHGVAVGTSSCHVSASDCRVDFLPYSIQFLRYLGFGRWIWLIRLYRFGVGLFQPCHHYPNKPRTTVLTKLRTVSTGWLNLVVVLPCFYQL